MKFDSTALYAALIHEMKNNLGLLSITLDSIPMQAEPQHDRTVNDARLLCQSVIDRLQQALLIFKANNQQLQPTIDAYSPHDLLHEVLERTAALSRERLHIDADIAPDVPAVWFFDRDLIEMALFNAIQNSLAYARTSIRIDAAMIEGCFALSVHDDSAGYPEHILSSVASNLPYRATGTGLGLQFAKLIVQAHENRGRFGELRLYNDSGAVFSLLLP